MTLIDWILAGCAFITVELTIFGAYLGLNVTVARIGETAKEAKALGERAHERIDGLLGFRSAKP